jgi:hypothetical protein
MADGPQILTLSKAEEALYSSGIRRGHAETLTQMAEQLKNAGDTAAGRIPPDLAAEFKDGLLEVLNGAISGYQSFAEQLAEPAAKARQEQQRLLERFCQLRARAGRPIVERLRAAARGALGGWRGEW